MCSLILRVGWDTADILPELLETSLSLVFVSFQLPLESGPEPGQ